MKLFYITDIALDDRAVHTIHIDEICYNLARLGNDVTLYAPRGRMSPGRSEYKTRFLNTPRVLVSLFYQIRLFFLLLRDMRTEKPAALYSRHGVFLFVPVIIAKIFRVPIIIEINGMLINELRNFDTKLSTRVLLKSGIIRFLEFINTKLATGFIVTTSGIANYIIRTYGIKPELIRVITNGVDADVFRPNSDPEIRSKLGLDKESLYIGYIGSFLHWQGVKYILQAVNAVCSQRPNVKFLVVGGGEEEASLRSFIEDNRLEQFVEIRPPISHLLVPDYINAVDICMCYLTKFKAGAGSPFKVYEYLACGKAVLLADIGGMRDEFKDAVEYVQPESSQALAKVLIELIDDPDRRMQKGIVGRKFIEEGHTWSAVAAKTEVFLKTQLK